MLNLVTNTVTGTVCPNRRNNNVLNALVLNVVNTFIKNDLCALLGAKALTLATAKLDINNMFLTILNTVVTLFVCCTTAHHATWLTTLVGTRCERDLITRSSLCYNPYSVSSGVRPRDLVGG